MRKKLFFVVGGIMASLLLWAYADDFYALLTKSYYVDESSLCFVDTFHLQSRAYHQSIGGGGRGGSNESKLVFQSTNGYSFSIDKELYDAIKDEKKLEDTFMYHDTKFTVFSTAAFCKKYKESDKPIFIRVYQLRIGNENYIDVSKISEYAKWNNKKLLVLTMFFVPFFTLLLYKEQKNLRKKTKQQIIIWLICLPVTLLIIILWL